MIPVPPVPRDTLLIPFAKAQEIGICAKTPQAVFMRINGKLQLIPFYVTGQLFQHGSDAYIAASTWDKYVIAGQVSIKPFLDPVQRMEREKRTIHIGEEPKKRGIRIHTICQQCGKDVLKEEENQ